MRDNFDLIAGAFCFGIGFVGIGYAMGSRRKLHDICDKIDRSIDELSDGIDVDLSDAVIKRAVNKAVETEVGVAVRYATNEAVKGVGKGIRDEVKSAVRASYSDVKQSVSQELERQVSRIDIQELKQDVVKKAKEDVAKKLDSHLDGILDDFNQNLGNVSKIYKSIAESMRVATGRSMGFS